jgi:hypothetical protein
VIFLHGKDDPVVPINQAQRMYSAGLAIEGLRQLERHGGSLMLERAFVGFLAIAPPDRKRPWREALGVKTDWTGDLTNLYREKACTRHPDAGGSNALMAELNVAYAEGHQELGLGNGDREPLGTFDDGLTGFIGRRSGECRAAGGRLRQADGGEGARCYPQTHCKSACERNGHIRSE